MGRIRYLKGLLLLATAAGAVILIKGMPGRQPMPAPPIKTLGISLMARGLQKAGGAAAAKVLEADGAHEGKLLAAALAKNPGHAPVLFRMAKLESEQGRLEEAARHLRTILQQEPDNPEARLELGKVLFQLGDVTEAISQTETILKSHPDYEDALYNLGAIYGNLGNSDRASFYWKRLIALDTGSARATAAQRMLGQLKVDRH